jgi:hypothetical protein
MSILTDADKAMLVTALRPNQGFHLATQWYFDWDPLPYQYVFHQVLIPNVTFIAGIASGKTTSVAASYLLDCMSIPHFRALNTSVTARQAVLPFEMINTWVEGNSKLERHIEDISLRPYPVIKFHNSSEYTFRTAGKDARYIRGEEYDRINYDEAGLDFDGYTVKVLRGRLRGVRPGNRPRMARLDVITSPTDAPWLFERYERGDKHSGKYDPKQYLSMRVETYMNTRLTAEQIALMEAEYPAEMIDVELRGMFPDYGMSMFPKGHVTACTDQSLYDLAYEGFYENKKRGWRLDENPRHGIMHYERPFTPGRRYVVAGDPGTDNPPKRNSGMVVAWDVTDKPYELVYFDWVAGKGSLNPFLDSFKHAVRTYRPLFKGIDATGTQKYIDELAFKNRGLEVDSINFSRDKEAMLNSLLYTINNQQLRFPPIKGLIHQLGIYTRDRDKEIAQDIVMTLAMASMLAEYVPGQPINICPPKPNYANRRARTGGAPRGRRR